MMHNKGGHPLMQWEEKGGENPKTSIDDIHNDEH